MTHVRVEVEKNIRSAAERMHRFPDMLSGPGQFYLAMMSAGCIAYYCAIRVYTGRWNSTFSWFWAACGALHLVLYLGHPFLGTPVCLCMGAVLAACWMTAILIGAQIVYAMKREQPGEVEYLVVLGAQVRGTQITNSLMQRLDAAYSYLMEHPGTVAVVSGGQGKGESVTEAEAMAENLIRRGIVAPRIFREERSASTLENLRFSLEYIGRREARVAVVTNGFHLYRALLLGKHAGYRNLSGIAAASDPVLFFNYLAREVIAVLALRSGWYCRP